MAFRMYLTDTDHKVLQFVEEMGSITILQCRNMFYKTQRYGYDIARKRLGKMVQFNKLKVDRDNVTSQNVYYMDKKLRKHDILVLDFYSHLIYSGASIVYFNPEQEWMNGKYRSDAYISYILNGKLYFNILEVVRTSGVDEEKYKNIYTSQEAQYMNKEIYRQTKEVYEKENINIELVDDLNSFPRLIIVDNINHKKALEIVSLIKTTQLDFSYNNFSKIFA